MKICTTKHDHPPPSSGESIQHTNASVLADVRENGENNKFIHAMDYLLSLNSFDIWTLRYHALRLDGCAMCAYVCVEFFGFLASI